MNKYKVEIVQTDRYTVDVLAETEAEAKKQAIPVWNAVCENGTYHMYQEGDTENDFGTIYDVTNTDDPFNPMNEPETCSVVGCKKKGCGRYLDGLPLCVKHAFEADGGKQ